MFIFESKFNSTLIEIFVSYCFIARVKGFTDGLHYFGSKVYFYVTVY